MRPEVLEVACCGVRELSGLQGASEKDVTEAMYTAKLDRAGYVFASTTSKMKVATRVLEALKFKRIHEFKNPNTSNQVVLWGKDITSLKIPKGSHDEDNFMECNCVECKKDRASGW